MVWKEEKQAVERIERVGDKTPSQQAEKVKMSRLKEYRSRAKNVEGLVRGMLNKFINDAKKGKTYSALELQQVFLEGLEKLNQFTPERLVRVVIVEGWKKKDGRFPIWEDINGDYIVEIWNDDQKQQKTVSQEDLNRMLRVIRQLKLDKEYTCYDIAKLLGFDWSELWKERMKDYFPKYYHPLKIFNELGVIKYGKNKKTIKRLH